MDSAAAKNLSRSSLGAHWEYSFQSSWKTVTEMLCLVEYWSCGLSEVLWKSYFWPSSHSLCSGLKQSQANGFSDLCELMMSNKNPLQSHLPRECCGDQGSCCNPQSLGVRTGSVCWNCCGLGLFLSPCIEPGVQMLSLVPALTAL